MLSRDLSLSHHHYQCFDLVPTHCHSHKMRSHLRIAVLECDDPVGKTKEKYGRFGNLFQELLEAGASRLEVDGCAGHLELTVSKYDVVKRQEYPEIGSVDAVLLTGSSKHIHSC